MMDIMHTQSNRIQNAHNLSNRNAGYADWCSHLKRKQEILTLTHYVSTLQIHTLIMISFIDPEIYKLKELAEEAGLYRHDVKKAINIMITNIQELNQYNKMAERDTLGGMTKNVLTHYRPQYEREHGTDITLALQRLASKRCKKEADMFRAMTKNFCYLDKSLGDNARFVGQSMIVNGLANVVKTCFNGFKDICERMGVTPTGMEYHRKFEAIEKATITINSRYGVREGIEEEPFFLAARTNLDKLSESIVTNINADLNTELDRIHREYIRWYMSRLVQDLRATGDIPPQVKTELKAVFGGGGKYLQLRKYLKEVSRIIDDTWDIDDIQELMEARNHRIIQDYCQRIIDMHFNDYKTQYNKMFNNPET